MVVVVVVGGGGVKETNISEYHCIPHRREIGVGCGVSNAYEGVVRGKQNQTLTFRSSSTVRTPMRIVKAAATPFLPQPSPRPWHQC